jgi:deoxyribodipyrimidine photo-lyase
MYENGLFIFRRDYRIVDNNGLNLINSKCKNVYTIFIFTPEQVGNGNDYKSNNAIQFMIESLGDLAEEIHKNGGRLYFFYGSNNKVVSDCVESLKINYVCFNSDYTPYAMERDTNIFNICKKNNIECESVHDYYLHEPGAILSGSGTPYKKFTPYYNAALKMHVQKPSKFHKIKFKTSSVHLSNTISLENAFSKFTKNNNQILVRGGRAEAIRTLKIALKTQKHYSETRDEVYKPTTLLSAYIKFGCISIREVYKTFNGNHDLIRQLFWRDFYMNILFSYPYVIDKPMKPAYSKIKWHNNNRWLNAWTKGETGFPIVDAAMRELNATGYMHNRARLIVASFLTKTLLLNWKLGEKYFATKLTDYDVASNNGNWQWISSSGADSQPYFRIFNPWSQGKECDPECIYIKKWVPELENVSVKDIHNWNTEWENYKNKDIKYSKPICNYEEQKEKALTMFRAIY